MSTRATARSRSTRSTMASRSTRSRTRVDVDLVHERVEVEPRRDGVQVEPGGDGVQVDPVEHGVEVHAGHDGVHVQHRGQPVQVHELADEGRDVEAGEHRPGRLGHELVRRRCHRPNGGGRRVRKHPGHRSVEHPMQDRSRKRQAGKDAATASRQRLRGVPDERGRDHQDRERAVHRVVLRVVVRVATRRNERCAGRGGARCVRRADPLDAVQRRVHRVHGHGGAPSAARLMRPPGPTESPESCSGGGSSLIRNG